MKSNKFLWLCILLSITATIVNAQKIYRFSTLVSTELSETIDAENFQEENNFFEKEETLRPYTGATIADYAGVFDVNTAALQSDLEESKIKVLTTADYNTRSADQIITGSGIGAEEIYIGMHFSEKAGNRMYCVIKLGSGLQTKFTDEAMEGIWREIMQPNISSGKVGEAVTGFNRIVKGVSGHNSMVCVSCLDPGHVRAAAKFFEYIKKFDPTANFMPGWQKSRVTAKLKVGNDFLLIDKEFTKDGDLNEYANFLYNCGIDYYEAELVKYSILECILLSLQRLESKWEKKPPILAVLTAQAVTAVPGAFYGWYTGKDLITGEDKTAIEQCLAVLDIIPGEVYVKLGIVSLLSATGVVVKNYTVKAVTASVKWLDLLPSALQNDIAKSSALRNLFHAADDVGREGLTKAWETLRLAEVEEGVRLGKNGELETVSKHLNDFKKSPEKLAQEIKEAGGYKNWIYKIDWNDGFFKSFDDFIVTFDRGKKLSPSTHAKVYELYKEKRWKDLEDLFKKEKINEYNGHYWPPANGGYDIKEVPLLKGMRFDRYQKFVNETDISKGVPKLTGSYTSPVENGKTFSYEARALEGTENSYDLYYEVEILKDLPFKGEQARIIPWHGWKGEGVQTRFNFSPDLQDWDKLITKGYIQIKLKSSPSSKFEVLSNNTIVKK